MKGITFIMIYLDHAATTPLDKRVLEEMLPYFTENFENPSVSYRSAVKIRSAIFNARKTISNCIGAKPEEIIFTGSGTEADNIAIKGIALQKSNIGKHIVSTKIEHPAVLNSLKELEKNGFEVTYVGVNDKGRVSSEDVIGAVRSDTILVSVMYANNETGVIQPIEEIGLFCREKGIPFHVDAVQAFGHIPVDVNKIYADLLSVSAHKIYGPKGIGFLYIRNGIKPASVISGGDQEKGIRPGTENVPAIIGLAKAASIICSEQRERIEKENKLTQILIDGMNLISNSKINTDLNSRLPGSVNYTFEGVEGESLMIQLDMRGICVSTGSACSLGSGKPSHVLKAMGLSDEEAKSSIRLTVGYENTEEEMQTVVIAIRESVEYLRKDCFSL